MDTIKDHVWNINRAIMILETGENKIRETEKTRYQEQLLKARTAFTPQNPFQIWARQLKDAADRYKSEDLPQLLIGDEVSKIINRYFDSHGSPFNVLLPEIAKETLDQEKNSLRDMKEKRRFVTGFMENFDKIFELYDRLDSLTDEELSFLLDQIVNLLSFIQAYDLDETEQKIKELFDLERLTEVLRKSGIPFLTKVTATYGDPEKGGNLVKENKANLPDLHRTLYLSKDGRIMLTLRDADGRDFDTDIAEGEKIATLPDDDLLDGQVEHSFSLPNQKYSARRTHVTVMLVDEIPVRPGDEIVTLEDFWEDVERGIITDATLIAAVYKYQLISNVRGQDRQDEYSDIALEVDQRLPAPVLDADTFREELTAGDSWTNIPPIEQNPHRIVEFVGGESLGLVIIGDKFLLNWEHIAGQDLNSGILPPGGALNKVQKILKNFRFSRGHEGAEDAAKREAQEEQGATIASTHHINGQIHADGEGIKAFSDLVVMVVDDIGDERSGDEQAPVGTLLLTPDELDALIMYGYHSGDEPMEVDARLVALVAKAKREIQHLYELQQSLKQEGADKILDWAGVDKDSISPDDNDE